MPTMSLRRIRVTKRTLGESYIAATGLLLGVIMIGRLVIDGSVALLWMIAGAVPILVLVMSVYWLSRIGFGGDQVWTVAVYSAAALGLGSGVVAVSGMTAGTGLLRAETLLLVTGLGTLTVAGGLVGVAREFQQSNRQLHLRNQVLHRVLRHNLRNDMSVVLCLLDELEAEIDPDQRERVDRTRERIESLVELTDKVRQVGAAIDGHGSTPEPVELSGLIEGHVERLSEEYPVDIETRLPDSARAHANGEFELVLDNIVQSAVVEDERPELGVALSTEGTTVSLRIEDRDWALPDADLAAVTNGAETALEHGLGVELWLVYWLVDANGGDISVYTADGSRYVHIRLERAADVWLPKRLA